MAKPIVQRGVEGLDPILTELYFDALRGGVDIARMPEAQEALQDAFLSAGRPLQVKKPRTRKQKANDKMQSKAFKMANEKLRTKSGALRKGVNQSDVAKRAQKELKAMKNKRGKTRSRRATGTPARKSSPRRSGGGRR